MNLFLLTDWKLQVYGKYSPGPLVDATHRADKIHPIDN